MEYNTTDGQRLATNNEKNRGTSNCNSNNGGERSGLYIFIDRHIKMVFRGVRESRAQQQMHSGADQILLAVPAWWAGEPTEYLRNDDFVVKCVRRPRDRANAADTKLVGWQTKGRESPYEIAPTAAM